MSRIDRFKGEVLVDALARQIILNGDRQAAEALANAGTPVQFAPGSELIAEGDDTDDAFFLLSGKVELRIKGEVLPYGRKSGEVVGEFAAINPELRRTSTVIAIDDVIALKCGSAELIQAAQQSRTIWRLIALELTRKIEQRNQLIKVSNDRPRLFLIATGEQREVAEELDLALSVKFQVDLWNEADLKPAGSYELERLQETALEADFAIVLAHPDDLESRRPGRVEVSQQSVLFELGFLISELGRQRTILLVPEDACDSAMPPFFKGIEPWCVPPVDATKPLSVTLGRIVRRIEDYVSDRKVRSRLGLKA